MIKKTYEMHRSFKAWKKQLKEQMAQLLEKEGGKGTLPYNIVLIGFMGVGKSKISRCFQRIFHMDIIEMDELIVEREQKSISDIFAQEGEDYFRDLETALLVELQGKTNTVISTGGGTPLRERNVAEMKKNGKVIWLTAKPETILERVQYSHDRPLLEQNKTADFIRSLLEEREEKYKVAADYIVSTDNRTDCEICIEILQNLLEE